MTLPVDERRRRPEHAKRAYMLRVAKRSALARKRKSGIAQSRVST
jgi:hypothetical protein